MKIKVNDPPRTYRVGKTSQIEIKDCARIELEPDEQVTFTTPQGAEYDVARKNWGFYATPSTDHRLKRFGLRAALMRGSFNRHYLFLKEQGFEQEFSDYLSTESQEILAWLDDSDTIEARFAKGGSGGFLCICGSSAFEKIWHYDRPPKCEIHFQFAKSQTYQRDMFRCLQCGHFLSKHQMNDKNLYSEDYVTSNYQDLNGIHHTFKKIINFPPHKSDNTGRVACINEFAGKHFHGKDKSKPTLLDIGSGLGVFPYKMKESGWEVTALDPDERSVQHLKEFLAINAVQGDFFKVNLSAQFDCITFNKVLEHVEDPTAMLQKARPLLKPGGFVYVELPDGEMAALDSDEKEREEFAIDHIHVFSAQSMLVLAKRAGFDLLSLERLKEPSTKYTFRMFLKKN